MQKIKNPTLRFAACLLATLAFLLPGCGDGDTATTEPISQIEPIAFYRAIEIQDLGMQVPENWETITEFSSQYPKNTLVAFRNNVQDHDFIANINVVQNPVTEGTQSADYALTMLNTLSGQLVNFKKISQTDFNVNIAGTSVPTYLIEFEGTNDSTEPVRKFIQLYAVKGTTAYIVTGTYDALDTQLAIDQVKQSLKTVYLK
ncbi:MAG: hypothetical protein WC882_02220 [Candidatus Gracilibacteria bacterium]